MTQREFSDYVAIHYDQFVGYVRGALRAAGGDISAAEDVVQGVLVRLLRRLGQIEAHRAGAYIFQALNNAATDRLRQSGKGGRGFRDGEDFADFRSTDLPTADIAVEEVTFTTAVARVRKRLSPQQQEVFQAFLRAKGKRSEARHLVNLPSSSSYDNSLNRLMEKFREGGVDYQRWMPILGAARMVELLREEFGVCPETTDCEGEQ